MKLRAALIVAFLWTRIAAADSAVVFNEIMYHPQTNEPALEWVELQNQMSVHIDLSGWRLDGGIDFTFPEGTVIRGRDYLVIASSPTDLTAAGGTNVIGPYLNRLSNAGERLRLRDRNSRIIDEVSYGSEGDWPVGPDGAGPSLARRRSNVAPDDARNWRASAQIGGTPGRINFPVPFPTILSNAAVQLENLWKFNDNGSDLGTGWREPSFDDSAWLSGSALFYQEDAPLPGAKNTPLTPGRATYYFRTRFLVSGGLSRVEIQLRHVLDDGAVGYLNGHELFRANMPEGSVSYATPAQGPVADAGLSGTISLAPEHLIEGTNVLAIEVHQAPLFFAYPQTVLSSQPIGYWRMGEAGATAFDFASAPAGTQAGSQNATFIDFLPANQTQAGPRPTDTIGAQPLAGFEPTNRAPRFAGNTDGGNDVVIVPDEGEFNFSATRIFTLEAWVNGPAAQEGGAAIIAKGTGGGGEQFAIDIASGTYRFFCWDGGTPNTAVVAPSSVGPNGTWQHVVAVLDGPAGRMKLYVNGVEVGSAVPRPTLINTAHEVSIGARKNSSSVNYDLNFDGRIDEVAIYNRALSPAEILAHFNAAFTNAPAFGHDTNDVVFGAELTIAETLPEPEAPLIAFNELASSTNSAFWLELINHGAMEVDLTGWMVARLGGTNRQYILGSQILGPGELLQITKAELGFGVDSGDRLVLYHPGKTNVADAVVAKKDPRGRSPDGTGDWWFPAMATPGASNNFVFRDELVINEIMYHQRELLPEAAVFSPTNLLVTITNLWRYNLDGVEQGLPWRMPDFDDSGWLRSNAVFYSPTNPFTLPAPKNTFLPLTNSAGQRIITFYFRTQFEFSGDTNGARLALRAIVDDGAVFYLNGAEVYRLNMPTTNIAYGTLATVNVGIPGFTGPVEIPAGSLRPGLNTLAVEVHQVAASSSDADFGTELLVWNELSPALPFRHSPESWVEIFNRSSNSVNLAGWRLDEGIDFRFPPNKTIGPGGYLVVARDPADLLAKHPGLNVVGPFTNRLSRSGEYFVLKDPGNNIADEVRYLDGQPWPEYADGGGSSLELIDPWADNLHADAWKGSDESSKAGWETYTWRATSALGQTGEPTIWHEFALCLLDGAGEVLLDDLSVIETPTNAPKQLLYNGNFDAGSSAHWRFVGNHRQSRVEPEPGNPGNHVLHLIATGPGEYQGNQIETTLTNNIAIVDGRQYEISFRARWLAGKRKVNARLYFNRLARTFDLTVPIQSGTPGQQNSRYSGNAGPALNDLSHTPATPRPGWPVPVSVSASDPQGVDAVLLKYSVSGGPWQSVPMTNHSKRYTGIIPGQTSGAIVHFYVEARDALGAVASLPAKGTNSRALYVVKNPPPQPGAVQEFRLIMTAADAAFLHTGTNTLSNELLGGTVIYNNEEIYYNIKVRLKGSFVGRNVARVGFHLVFNTDQLFRGVHQVVSVDRSQHTIIGGSGELIINHIGNHAGGIPTMYRDLTRFLAPLPAYSTTAELRLSAYDNDYLDAQFSDGSDGQMFEVEVLRWNLATVDGNPESPKQVGNESGGTGYANLEVQNYGDNEESYRWFLLAANNRTADDYSRGIAMCKLFGLTGAAFDAEAEQVLDVNHWLRVMAFQQLVGPADAYFTGANIHNFRVYTRPEDQKVLYLPWDWDSAFLASTSASILGSGNIAKLLANMNWRRNYLNHLYDVINSSFNTSYMSPWLSHFSSLGNQDLSGVLNYINARANYVLSQLPTGTAFAITSNNGNNFSTNNSYATLVGTAPIGVHTIEINGLPYPLTWTSTTAWRTSVPLYDGVNSLVAQGVDSHGNRLTNASDTITVTNTGLAALRPVVINEWMADNAAPGGFPDPVDGLFQDWFELYNPNTNAVNLSGFYLTDNLEQPTKWRIPSNTVLAARSFLLVWADNDTAQNGLGPAGDLHAGFQLSAGGEEIGLFTPDGVTPHSTIVFAEQFQNISEGLFTDGDTNSLHTMTNWTPRAANVLDALPAPEVSGLIVDEGGFVSFSFSAMPNRTYQIQYKNDLVQPEWSLLRTERGHAAGQVIVIDELPSSELPQRFYRIVLLQ